MSKIRRFVVSDTHFYSCTTSYICNQPFKSIRERNKMLVNNWNSVVKKNDLVYHLGDFSDDPVHFFEIENVKKELNGRIRLILGNHDRVLPYCNWLEFGFDRVYDQPIVIDNFIMLSHEPLFLNDLANSNAKAYLNIHGHIHGNVYNNAHYINACVERHDYKPVDLDLLVKNSIIKLREEINER